LELDSTQPVVRLVNEIVPWANEAGDSEVEEVFSKLVAEWTTAVASLCSMTTRTQHPAYQKIIALGQAAVPLLLRELEERPNHWFAALRTLTGVNPVPLSERGKIDLMAKAWLRWGEEHGYL
jgi:hypothetical protein